MRQDDSRNRPAFQSVWSLRDFLRGYGAPLRGRGGWAHHSSDISAQTGTASYIKGGVFATFSLTSGALNEKNLCLDEDGLLYSVGASTATLIGTAFTVLQNPIFHGGTAATAATAVFTGLAIIPDGTGAAVPKKYDGTTLGDLPAGTPKARFATVFKNYTVLGNGSTYAVSAGSAVTSQFVYYPNRIWFSPLGDPDVAIPASTAATAWDILDAWIDFSEPVAGLAATKNALIVFLEGGQIARVRGNTAPPEEDMEVDDPFLSLGLLDPFSIIQYKDNVYWCAPEGVYRTDGVVDDDLTKKGGMLRYWLDMNAATASSAYSYSTGVIRDTLIITVMNGTSLVDAFAVDLQSYVWTRLSNLDATSMWSGLIGASDECFFGRRGAARVGRLDTMFSGVGNVTYKNDGNGTAVTPSLETPFFEVKNPGLKRIKRLFTGYRLQDYASDNPTLDVSYITSPEETSYTSLGSLGEVSDYARRSLSVNKRISGIAFKFQQTNAGDLEIHDLMAEFIVQEGSKRA